MDPLPSVLTGRRLLHSAPFCSAERTKGQAFLNHRLVSPSFVNARPCVFAFPAPVLFRPFSSLLIPPHPIPDSVPFPLPSHLLLTLVILPPHHPGPSTPVLERVLLSSSIHHHTLRSALIFLFSGSTASGSASIRLHHLATPSTTTSPSLSTALLGLSPIQYSS